MLLIFIIMMFLLVFDFQENLLAMDKKILTEFSYKTFANVAQYLNNKACLNDYSHPEIMGLIIANNYNINQEQIEIKRRDLQERIEIKQRGLQDYNDLVIQKIIVANDYDMSQQHIDIIKNSTIITQATIYCDELGNNIIISNTDLKLVQLPKRRMNVSWAPTNK